MSKRDKEIDDHMKTVEARGAAAEKVFVMDESAAMGNCLLNAQIRAALEQPPKEAPPKK